MSRWSRFWPFLLFAFVLADPVGAQVGLLVNITAPGAGSNLGGTIPVRASVTVPSATAGVQFQVDGANLDVEDTEAPYEIAWDTRTSSNGTHALRAVARDTVGLRWVSDPVVLTVWNGGDKGDVFVALTNGVVQWHAPDGTLRRTLTSVFDGESSGIAFDAARNLYVPHWYSHTPGGPGNTLERFDEAGNRLGTFGSYDCDPSSVAVDASGNVYVGQADCTGDILKFDSTGSQLASFDAATGVRGADHIALASDGCTMFYTAWTHDVLRYDVCANAQLPNFNTQPLPGDTAFQLKVLPDGGVLVADCQVIARLDAAGNPVWNYTVPDESNWWMGLDLVGDGTFWAVNAVDANVFRFDIETGAVLSVFNAGTGAWSAAGVAVKP